MNDICRILQARSQDFQARSLVVHSSGMYIFILM